LGQTHSFALIGHRAPGLGYFQDGLPMLLRDRVTCQPLTFDGSAAVLG